MLHLLIETTADWLNICTNSHQTQILIKLRLDVRSGGKLERGRVGEKLQTVLPERLGRHVLAKSVQEAELNKRKNKQS